MHCQPCSILPPAAETPRALRSRRQRRDRAPHNLLPYLPRQTAFPATRYAAVTPEPSARRLRAAACSLGPAPGRLGQANHIPLWDDPQPRLSQVAPPHDATARHTPSILAQRAGLTCGPRAPPAGTWEDYTVGATLLPVLEASFFGFPQSPYTPRFVYNFCCLTNHFLLVYDTHGQMHSPQL